MQRSSGCDLEPDCVTGGDCNSSACNMFDEMPVSDWRSPSRVLEITIHQVRYPITEKLLRRVFDPFGVVEEVYVCEGLERVEAQVVFQSKHDAVEAYGDLYGRNIYDGCCQLVIQFGCPQEREATPDTSHNNTAASSTSALPQASSASTTIKEVVTDSRLAAAASPTIDTVTSDTNADATTNCSTKCLSVVSGVPASHGVQGAAPMASATSTRLDINIWTPTASSLAPSAHASLCELKVFDEMPCSPDALPSNNINMYASRNISTAAPASPKVTTLGVAMLPGGELTVVHIAYQMDAHKVSGIICDESVLVTWPPPMKCVEWQPWPSLASLEIKCVAAELRPIPWPSFICYCEPNCRNKESSESMVEMSDGYTKLEISPWLTLCCYTAEVQSQQQTEGNATLSPVSNTTVSVFV